MKISIITVSYNSSDTIEKTLRSVAEQCYPDIEHIIIDGSSTDATLDIIEKHRSRIEKVISEPDEGIYYAMNKGIENSTGDVIAFLNSDDFYKDETVISKVAERFQNKDIDAVYGDLVYVSPKDEDKIIRYWKAGNYKPGAFLKGWLPPHPTFICRKEIFQKYGVFDTEFKIAADYELMFRLIEKNNINIYYVPEVLVKMNNGGTSNRITGIIKANYEVMRAFRKNGYPISLRASIMKPLLKIPQLFLRPGFK